MQNILLKPAEDISKQYYDHFYDFDETFGRNCRGQEKNYVCDKPMVVVDYNRGKCAVDLSDQMIAYSTPHRRTLKLYTKLAFRVIVKYINFKHDTL